MSQPAPSYQQFFQIGRGQFSRLWGFCRPEARPFSNFFCLDGACRYLPYLINNSFKSDVATSATAGVSARPSAARGVSAFHKPHPFRIICYMDGSDFDDSIKIRKKSIWTGRKGPQRSPPQAQGTSEATIWQRSLSPPETPEVATSSHGTRDPRGRHLAGSPPPQRCQYPPEVSISPGSPPPRGAHHPRGVNFEEVSIISPRAQEKFKNIG